MLKEELSDMTSPVAVSLHIFGSESDMLSQLIYVNAHNKYQDWMHMKVHVSILNTF